MTERAHEKEVINKALVTVAVFWLSIHAQLPRA